MKRVLILGSKEFPFRAKFADGGGIERYVEQYVNQNKTNYYYIITRSADIFSHHYKFNNAEVFEIPFINTPSLSTISYIFNSWPLFHYLVNCKHWDEIHVHEPTAGLIASISCANRYNLFLHSMGSKEPADELRQKFLRFCEQTAFFFAKRIYVISRRIAVAHKLKYAKKFNIIVDKRFTKVKRKVILFIGRLSKVNNINYLMRAFDLLPNKPLLLMIVGDGEEHDFIERWKKVMLSCKKNSNKHVMLLGRRDDVYDIMQFADVVVFPALSAGTPNVVLEALACGKKVIASDVGDVSRYVSRKYLFNPIDYQMLSDRLCEVLKI